MTQFIYDGSYIGLLSTIFEVYDRKCEEVSIVNRDKIQGLMFMENMEVVSDYQKASRVLKGLQKKVSQQTMMNIYRCYLSELPGIENSILQLIQYIFSSTQNIESDYGNKYVIEIAQIARRVGREKHRFEAFVRFENIGDKLFYAPIDPDYNVLPLIIPHFKSRYANQDWIIYDTKRKYGVHYNQQTEQVNEAVIDFDTITNKLTPTGISFDPEEKLYQGLWQNYFKSVNIPIRKNTKLHLQHVPKRYWKYLVEKKNN